MGRKLLTTPRSRVKACLHRLWLSSRERSSALKREEYCCEECGIKQSKAKGREVAIEVHHIEENMKWDRMINFIFETLLVDPSKLKVLCKDCHKDHHA